MDFYVYLHRKASNGEVFYVGKGRGDRKYDIQDRSVYWKRIVKKHGRTIEVVRSGLSEHEAFALEADLIRKYGRHDLGKGPLCNMTDGGDGASGQIMSESAKDKVRQAQMGNTTWKGRKHRPETKEKMRKPKSEETKAKMRKPKSEAMRKKLSEMKKQPVLCSNGMLFPSARDAQAWLRSLGLVKAHESGISQCCRGKIKTAYGFSWTRDLQ